jgi:hypothetical protein
MDDKENLSQDSEITAENNDTIKEFLGDQPKEEVKETDDTSTPEEKPSQEAPSEPESTPEVPLEEVIEEVKAKTKEEVKEEILKSLGMSKEEKQEVEDAGFKFAWEKRGEEAPASWKEQAEETVRLWNWQKEQQDLSLQETQRQQMADEQARQLTINAEWDTQLEYLRQEGLIPEVADNIQKKLKEGKILTATERQDAGLKAQVGIFEAMYQIAQEREAAGLPPIADVVHVYNRYYKAKQTPLAGRKAPVSGGSTPISQESEDVPYDDLHSKGFEDLLKS